MRRESGATKAEGDDSGESAAMVPSREPGLEAELAAAADPPEGADVRRLAAAEEEE